MFSIDAWKLTLERKIIDQIVSTHVGRMVVTSTKRNWCAVSILSRIRIIIYVRLRYEGLSRPIVYVLSFNHQMDHQIFPFFLTGKSFLIHVDRGLFLVVGGLRRDKRYVRGYRWGWKVRKVRKEGLKHDSHSLGGLVLDYIPFPLFMITFLF